MELFFDILEYHSRQTRKSKTEGYRFFGKSRTGYIFPCILRVAEAPSFSNRFTFIIQIFLEKNIRRSIVGYLLMDNNFIIYDLSSECTNLLGLSKTNLSSFEDLQAFKIFPNLNPTELTELYSPEGTQLLYIPPVKDTENESIIYIYICIYIYIYIAELKSAVHKLCLGISGGSGNYLREPRASLLVQNEVRDSMKRNMFQGWIENIQIFNDHKGYLLQIEQNVVFNPIDISIIDYSNDFQFRYDPHIDRYIREYDGDEGIYTYSLILI